MGGLVSCGKPLERPTLPGPKSTSVDLLILGRELTARDLRELFSILNEKGEFNHLSQWMGQLSDSELSAWGQFLTEHVYQDALSPKGLIQIAKTRVQERGFSTWAKSLKKLAPVLPSLVNDPDLWNLIPRLVPVLEPIFNQRVIKPLVPEKNELNHQKVLEDLFKLLRNEETRSKLQDLSQLMLKAEWVTPVSETSREWLKKSGEDGFGHLSKAFSEKIVPLNQALQLAKLLNRSGEKIVSCLQEGLRSNPDIVHALSMKWDPIFVRSLSKMVKEVLLKPEDGGWLDRAFWLALPRADPGLPPTPQFIRLYSILYSGILKISDPRRLEPQADGGSYRLPLQLNALFLTRFLEEVAHQSAAQIQKLEESQFEEGLWNLPLTVKEFQLSLVKEDSKVEISNSVKQDLQSLGLQSALSRLENLVREEDSGKNSYGVSFGEENISLTQGFSEALASAHSVRPFSDVTPFLMVMVQGLSQGPWESSPNLLAQLHGFVAQLDREQWKLLKKILFEELKIGQLEMEDRALLVSLFQSDMEVAEWVNEVLIHVQSIYELDESDSDSTLFGFYHLFLTRVPSAELSTWGELLSRLSDLSLFSTSEEGTPVFPGFYSILKNGPNLTKWLRGLAGLSKVQVRMLQEKVSEVLGENLDGELGADQVFSYLLKLSQRMEPQQVSHFIDQLSEIHWNLKDAEAQWIVDFSKLGGFRILKKLIGPENRRLPILEIIDELQTLSKKRVIDEGMRLLTRIQNERMKEIALVVLEMDNSEELLSMLDLIRNFFQKGETP